MFPYKDEVGKIIVKQFNSIEKLILTKHNEKIVKHGPEKGKVFSFFDAYTDTATVGDDSVWLKIYPNTELETIFVINIELLLGQDVATSEYTIHRTLTGRSVIPIPDELWDYINDMQLINRLNFASEIFDRSTVGNIRMAGTNYDILEFSYRHSKNYTIKELASNTRFETQVKEFVETYKLGLAATSYMSISVLQEYRFLQDTVTTTIN